MSAICTNGQVTAGVHYIISRTVDPQFGGSFGMILSIASIFAVSLYYLVLQFSMFEYIIFENKKI